MHNEVLFYGITYTILSVIPKIEKKTNTIALKMTHFISHS